MAYKPQILLGKISKIHSHEGAVIIRLERKFSEKIPEMESVFLEIDGRPVPFFISHCEQPDMFTLRLKFEDYHSAEKVKEFVGCRVFMTATSSDVEVLPNPPELIDYTVLSEDNSKVGVVAEIIENPGQLLLNIISSSGKYYLLPFHSDLIIKLDAAKKVIRMIIPEGITDIN